MNCLEILVYPFVVIQNKLNLFCAEIANRCKRKEGMNSICDSVIMEYYLLYIRINRVLLIYIWMCSKNVLTCVQTLVSEVRIYV